METNENLAESLGLFCYTCESVGSATACLSVCLQTEQEQDRERRNMMETGGTARGEEEEWREERRKDEEERMDKRKK